MATSIVELRTLAMNELGYTVRDLRNTERRAEIYARADEMRDEELANRKTNTLTQALVANTLLGFAGFADDPSQIGPTVAQVHDRLVEEGHECRRAAVVQHLNKLRGSKFIESCEVMEHSGKGRVPHFYFLTNEDGRWDEIVSGDLLANGKPLTVESEVEGEVEGGE